MSISVPIIANEMIVPYYVIHIKSLSIVVWILRHHGFIYLFILDITGRSFIRLCHEHNQGIKHPPVVSNNRVKCKHIDRSKQLMGFCLIWVYEMCAKNKTCWPTARANSNENYFEYLFKFYFLYILECIVNEILFFQCA